MADRPRGDWDCVAVARDTYNEKQKKRKENQYPQPWILQKLAVGVVLGIVVWTYYVYVGRICIKLLNRGETVKGGVYIAIFNLFFLMFSWTYLKVIVTPPGFARDHVPQCEPPSTTQYGRPWDIDSEVRGTDDGHRTIGTAYEGMSEPGGAVELDAIPPVASIHARITSPPLATQGEGTQNGKKPIHVNRNPPQTPVLAAEYRYCARDRLMKPMRTHHCRLCATCVLQYDHHCPWIGQCVGAYNRKFFLNFTFWSTWFTAWVFGTLLADVIVDSRNIYYELDGQEIAIIAFHLS
ncbi:hypothetical protein OPQ81_002148 [Rhizoctonia solani]|nr:hypothetical protein OPQ81_002148 [Rhizoctonia solani]